jgi:ABC-type multidrug transport system ATPase subunit
MAAAMHISTFQTYERLVGHIENQIDVCLPILPAGKAAFFLKLGKWLRGSDATPSRTLFILPDPSSNLAFPTPREELSSALFVSTGAHPSNKDVESLLSSYHLASSTATQAVSSLSGGERFLLSLAKARALLPSVDELILSNPTQWLNRSKYPLLAELCRCYLDSGKLVQVAAMEGEAVPLQELTPNVSYACLPLKTYIPWELEFIDLRVTFNGTAFPTYHESFSLTFQRGDCSPKVKSIKLHSPTLIIGDNGAGKSTFGKLLAGVINAAQGEFELRCGGSAGTARIMLQESIEQLFGKTALEHINWVFRFDKAKHSDAENIYKKIDETLRDVVIGADDLSQDLIGSKHAPNTLLQGKMALVAERLATNPTLLILDEPGWGLTPKIAVPLVRQVCEIAHQRGTAVAIITHQIEVWNGLARSRINLEHSANGVVVVNSLTR